MPPPPPRRFDWQNLSDSPIGRRLLRTGNRLRARCVGSLERDESTHNSDKLSGNSDPNPYFQFRYSVSRVGVPLSVVISNPNLNLNLNLNSSRADHVLVPTTHSAGSTISLNSKCHSTGCTESHSCRSGSRHHAYTRRTATPRCFPMRSLNRSVRK